MDLIVPSPPTPTAATTVMRLVAMGRCGPLTTQPNFAKVFLVSVYSPPPTSPAACCKSGGGGVPPGVPRVLYIWDNVKVKLTHFLFKCMMYMFEFVQSFLTVPRS
jgi:hypothetical protein